MLTRTRLFQYCVGAIGAIHLFIGIAGSLSGEWSQRVAFWMWGAVIEVTPQYLFVSKLLNAYLIAFAIVMFFIAKDPIYYKKLFIVPIVALGLQLLESVVFFDSMNTAFNMASGRNLVNIVSLAVFIVAILVLHPYRNQKN